MIVSITIIAMDAADMHTIQQVIISRKIRSAGLKLFRMDLNDMNGKGYMSHVEVMARETYG